jgi:hypothetical protein
MNLSGKYVVHELHSAAGTSDVEGTASILSPHPNEVVGLNIQANSQRFWHNVGSDVGIRVDAGLIEHRGA